MNAHSPIPIPTLTPPEESTTLVVEEILETLPHPAVNHISFAARLGDGRVVQFVFITDREALTLAHGLEGLYHARHPAPRQPAHGGTDESEDPERWPLPIRMPEGYR